MAKMLCQISAQHCTKTAQKGHKTKHTKAQNKHNISTKQAQKGHKLSTEKIINLE
jgi:hypothetical protein